MDIPGAARLPEYPALNAPKLDGRSRARGDRSQTVQQYATGTYTKQVILQKATQWGLTNRRGEPLTSQVIGMLLRNRLRLYTGLIDVRGLAFAISAATSIR